MYQLTNLNLYYTVSLGKYFVDVVVLLDRDISG